MQRRLFEFNGALVLHFKKMNRQKLTSNYPTLFSLDFNRQLELPNLPATLPRLVAGYIPKADWSGVEGVYITCPNGSEIEWFIDLSSENLISTTHPTPQVTKTTHADKPARKRQRIIRDGESGKSAEANS